MRFSGSDIVTSGAGLQRNRTSGTFVNAMLILRQGDKILFSLRKNTGFCDGLWGFVSGHVEDGESATHGMIREAHEEIGIEIDPSHIHVSHIMHRKTNRLNIDIFFECDFWNGVIHNAEPEKCEKLAFFSFNALPANIIEYHANALKHIAQKMIYSEMGWEL